MKRYLLLFGLILIFLMGGIKVSAQQDSLGIFKAGENITLIQLCGTCTSLNISSITNPNSEILVSDVEMIQSGTQFSYFLEGGNTSGIYGRYNVNGYGDKDGSITPFAYYFIISPSGALVSGSQVAAYTVLFIFLVGFIIMFRYFTAKINYEKWYKSILTKYEYRNTIKVIISSIGFNVMKNTFIWYYLFGLPIILLITDITYTFGVSSMIDLMKIILAIYWFGFILVGLFFFGFLQEWVFSLVDEIKNLDYGVGG